MELFLGITLLAASFILGLIIYVSKDIGPDAALGALFIMFLFAGFCSINEYYSPSIAPIDVYRGKTTLEITYRNNIAIDSTVIWKEEVK